MSGLVDFVILLLMEVILGVDNIIFVNLAVKRLPSPRVVRAFGLTLALMLRIVLLVGVDFLMNLDQHQLVGAISIKDLVLFAGGLFLVFKGGAEIRLLLFSEIERERKELQRKPKGGTLRAILSIISIDLVFSIDSVTAAFGITRDFIVISCAFFATGVVMILCAEWFNRVITARPVLNIASMGFIVAVGLKLILEGGDLHVDHLWFYGFSAVWIGVLLFAISRFFPGKLDNVKG